MALVRQQPSDHAAAEFDLDAVLAGIAPGPEEDPSVLKAYFALLEALKAHPELVQQVEAKLLLLDANSPALKVMVGALVGCGTPAAQAALAHVIQERSTEAAIMAVLLPTVGFTAHPTTGLQDRVNALAEHSPDQTIRSDAGLAMGALARNLGDSDPSRSVAIVDALGRRVAASSDINERHALLAALGNAGTAQVSDVVAPYLSDSDPVVRADAVSALRLVPGDDAANELLRVLREDANPDVRASAAWALSFREPSYALVSAESSAMVVEGDERVAKQLLANVWNGISVAREVVIAALRQAAQTHPVAAVKEGAGQLLAQASAAG